MKALTFLCLIVPFTFLVSGDSRPAAQTFRQPKDVPLPEAPKEQVAQNGPPDKKEPKLTPVPSLAVRAASLDAASLDDSTRRYTRYIWIPGAAQDPDMWKAVVFALNSVSQANNVYRPFVLAKGELLRVNLLGLVQTPDDLDRYADVWEGFANDPAFSLLVTRDMIEALLGLGIGDEQVKVKITVEVEKKASDGKGPPFMERKSSWKTMAVKDAVKEVALVRLNPSNLPELAELQSITTSEAPITHYGYFLVRALSSVRDDGIFKDLWGGLYYDLAGIESKERKKGTDQDALLEKLGVGTISGGVSADDIFSRIRSDQRAACFRSKVTGRWRRIAWFQTLAARDALAEFFITGDVAQKDLDISQNSMMNLDTLVDRAREAIYVGPNGFLFYSLFNNKGKRQDEVPFDIAVDRTIPSPHPMRLQAGIGCIRCHGPFEGLQPFENDARTILTTNFDVFGDISRGNLDLAILDTNRRLAGWYAGAPDRVLRLVRNDFNAAVLRACGPWKASKDQTDLVRIASARVGDLYNAYFYNLVSPRDALLELGFDVPDEEAVATLRKLVPPEPSYAGSVVPEDVRIAALLTGISINRTDFALTFPFLSLRIQRSQKGG